MQDPRRVCFDISGKEYEILEDISAEAEIAVEEYVGRFISQHVRGYQHSSMRGTVEDRRRHPRKEVLFPGVACVNFSDSQELRSFSVTVQDISMGGVRIRFNQVDTDVCKMLSEADKFELVFSVPDSAQTVSILCSMRHLFQSQHISMAGEFHAVPSTSLSAISAIVN